MEEQNQNALNLNSVLAKLKSNVTVTAPGWVFAAGAVLLLILILD